MAKAFLSKNSTVTVDAKLIGGLKSISLPEVTPGQVDTTSHDTTGLYREKIATLFDVGEVSLSGNLLKGDVGQSYMRANPGKEVEVVITLPNGMTVSFSALIGKTGGSLPFDNVAEFTGSLIPTGEVTISEAA